MSNKAIELSVKLDEYMERLDPNERQKDVELHSLLFECDELIQEQAGRLNMANYAVEDIKGTVKLISGYDNKYVKSTCETILSTILHCEKNLLKG